MEGDTKMTNKEIIQDWKKKGRPVPPPNEVKYLLIQSYGERFSINTLIETGTLRGGMIAANKDHFKKIISIELADHFYEYAKKRFSSYPHISIIQGDSGKVLPDILQHISDPCLFWLDGHYSGGNTAKGELETPIVEELHHILNHHVKNHVILIDDARLFTGKNDYPTIHELKRLVMKNGKNRTFEVKDDMIRIF